MPVQFVSNHYRNELGNPGEKQVGMKRFLILGFTPGNTKTVFEMADGFLNISSDFVGGVPFIRTTDCTGIGTQVFLRIKIKHPAAGRFRTRIIGMANTLTFTRFLMVYPCHFGAYKLHSRESAAQMQSASFPFHRQGRIFWTAGTANLKGSQLLEGRFFR